MGTFDFAKYTFLFGGIRGFWYFSLEVAMALAGSFCHRCHSKRQKNTSLRLRPYLPARFVRVLAVLLSASPIN